LDKQKTHANPIDNAVIVWKSTHTAAMVAVRSFLIGGYMKRIGAIVLSIALTAGLLLASPAQAAKKTLLIWATGDDASTKVTQAAAKVFMRKNPGVKVTVQTIGWGDGYAKVLSAAAAKKGPDIITGGLSWGISLGNQGALADLRPLGLANFVQPKVPTQIYRSLIAYGSSKVYAVPYDLTLMMMFYDKKTFQKAGITSAPKTIEQFNAAAQKLKSTAGVTVPVYNEWGNADWLGWFNWLYSSGGSLYNSKCKVSITSAKSKAALQQYKKLYDDYGALKPGVADWSMNDNLKNGKYGIGFSGNFQASSLFTFYRDYKDWDAAPVPSASGEKSISFIGGRGISIMKYSKKKALAASFIKGLYDVNTVTAMNAVGSIENSIFLSPVLNFTETIVAYPASVLKTIKNQLRTAQGPPNCVGWEDSQADVTKEIQAYLFDNKNIDAALAAAAAVMKSNL
jgi:ABC-type glycerol-3-phosphate transport system substrate-binding protein